MEQVNLKIDDMGCGACVAKAREALEATPGVTVHDVRVGSAALTRDPARAPDAAILETLSRAGYRATLEVRHGNDNGSCCGARAR